MKDLIIWKILIIAFHFDIRDNKDSIFFSKMTQSHILEVQKFGNMQNTLKIFNAHMIISSHVHAFTSSGHMCMHGSSQKCLW